MNDTLASSQDLLTFIESKLTGQATAAGINTSILKCVRDLIDQAQSNDSDKTQEYFFVFPFSKFNTPHSLLNNQHFNETRIIENKKAFNLVQRQSKFKSSRDNRTFKFISK